MKPASDLSADQVKASTGCVRETPLKKGGELGMCKRNPLDKKQKQSQLGICKSNSPDKNEGSTGCVRGTPQIEMKPAWDV